MKVSANVISTESVANIILLLFVLSWQQNIRTKLSANWVPGKDNFFVFYIASSALLQKHAEFLRCLTRNSLIIVLCFVE